MTPERLAEIRARLDAATPGPWGWDPDSDGEVIYAGNQDWPTEAEWEVNEFEANQRIAAMVEVCTMAGWPPEKWLPNAQLIAHAPTDIAALLAEVERLKDEVVEARKFWTIRVADPRPCPHVVTDEGTETCPACRGHGGFEIKPYVGQDCSTCNGKGTIERYDDVLLNERER